MKDGLVNNFEIALKKMYDIFKVFYYCFINTPSQT